MRKLLEEVKEIEQYIHRQTEDGERLVMEARMILSRELKQRWRHQLLVHRLIYLLGREEKRAQLNNIHTRLMADKDFNAQIRSIF